MKTLCIVCGEELEEKMDLITSFPAKTERFCNNEKCPRYGLITVVWREQDWKTTDE
jgi:hypothetical protein